MRASILSIICLISLHLCAFAEDYYDVRDLTILGTVNKCEDNPYGRLPQELQSQIRPDLWKLGQNTAGLSVRFATDATNISARWTSKNKTSMNHMCPTGIRGLDLYMLMPDNTWAFVGSARPSLTNAQSTSTFVSGLPKQMREYMMFLSLYDGIDDLEIGVNSGAKVTDPAVDLPVSRLPIVMYGTSILQGGCATRPGMAHTNILQRMLNREVYNFGFSGNGHLDLPIAKLMSEIEASAYVIDVLPNNTSNSIQQKLPAFYDVLRKAHPTTPILLVESPYYPRCTVDTKYRSSINSLNHTLRNFYESTNDPYLYYFSGEEILDPDCEGSIDGVHFTDIGFEHFAKALYPMLQTLIED